MPLELLMNSTAAYIPNTNTYIRSQGMLIPTSAGQDLSCRVKRDGQNAFCMPLERSSQPARLGIPQPDRRVIRRRRQHPSVRRPRDAPYRVCMTSQRAYEFYARRELWRRRFRYSSCTVCLRHFIRHRSPLVCVVLPEHDEPESISTTCAPRKSEMPTILT